jgi:hypothetical protein
MVLVLVRITLEHLTTLLGCEKLLQSNLSIRMCFGPVIASKTELSNEVCRGGARNMRL